MIEKIWIINFQQQKRYMISSTSAIIPEALRNVPNVLFIKSHCLSGSEFVIFMNALNIRVIP